MLLENRVAIVSGVVRAWGADIAALRARGREPRARRALGDYREASRRRGWSARRRAATDISKLETARACRRAERARRRDIL